MESALQQQWVGVGRQDAEAELGEALRQRKPPEQGEGVGFLARSAAGASGSQLPLAPDEHLTGQYR
jgi:hypothetical protein